jgi:hypothetical protein
MPIEIKELVIRAVAVTSADKGEASPKGARPARGAAPTGGRDEIVQECVQEVLRILRRAEER